MTQKVVDCAIVGGGLAGLTLAVQLANSGRSVILFEKEKFPFHKVCGEYISMESFGFLEKIGIPLSTMNLPMITELKISAPNGNAFTRNLDLGGFGISRYTLDALLAELAISKGVTLLQETKVTAIHFENDAFTLKTGSNSYNAKIVCGAYGKSSNIDKKLNRKSTKMLARKSKNYVAVKYHVKADLASNRIELHNFKDGYCGISKVDGDKYCMCYITTAENLKNNSNDIKKMEQNVLARNPFLKKYFLEATFLYTQPLTISQITFTKKSSLEAHVLLLGDAAGTIAPLCGNGMSLAMHSSYIAFQLIEKYLTNELTRSEIEIAYSQQWDSLFSNRIRTGKYMQHLFGGEVLTNAVIGLLKKMPLLTDKLIKLTHGKKFS